MVSTLFDITNAVVEGGATSVEVGQYSLDELAIISQVAYFNYLGRIKCGCMSCVEGLGPNDDWKMGELHLEIMGMASKEA